MSIFISALISIGVFFLWAASLPNDARDFRFRMLTAVVASVCIGIAGGQFYALLDFPVVWP